MQETVTEMIGMQTVTQLESVLASWLPDGTGIQGGFASDSLVIPEADLRHVAKAVAKRRAEFIGGRWCAYRAIEKIGMSAHSLPANGLGGPTWPAGVAGSITHDSGLCLAVATRNASIVGVGIDLFDTARAAGLDELVSAFLTTRERDAILHSGRPNLPALLFSAKESVIKAVSSRMGKLIDFREIEVTMTELAFIAHVDGYSHAIRGRCCDQGRFILTMATRRAASPS